MQPLVSIIIPCYSPARYLGQAIESVLAQTHRCYEIIVIDDVSPENVAEIVQAYPEVRYRRQERRGLSEARNRGLAECTGEYVVFLDADDRLLPSALAAGVEALSSHPSCGFVWGLRRLIDASGAPLPGEPNAFGETAEYARLLRENIVGPPVTVMFRRSVVTAVGGFSPLQRYSEDYELFLRIARSYDTWCHQKLIAEYRLHDANMSLNAKGMLEGNLLALDQQESWVGDDADLRRAIREGRRIAWTSYDQGTRMQQLSYDTRAKRWVPAIIGGAILLVMYPGAFLPVLARRIKRGLRSPGPRQTGASSVNRPPSLPAFTMTPGAEESDPLRPIASPAAQLRDRLPIH